MTPGYLPIMKNPSLSPAYSRRISGKPDSIMSSNGKEAVIVSPEQSAGKEGPISIQMERFECIANCCCLEPEGSPVTKYHEGDDHRVHGIILGSGLSEAISYVMKKINDRIGNKGCPTSYEDGLHLREPDEYDGPYPLISVGGIGDLIHSYLRSPDRRPGKINSAFERKGHGAIKRDSDLTHYFISFLVAGVGLGRPLGYSEVLVSDHKRHDEVPAYAGIGPGGISPGEESGSEHDGLSTSELAFMAINEYSRLSYHGPKKERRPKIAVISNEDSEILDQDTSILLGNLSSLYVSGINPGMTEERALELTREILGEKSGLSSELVASSAGMDAAVLRSTYVPPDSWARLEPSYDMKSGQPELRLN